MRLHPSLHTLSVRKGDTASLSLIVCADPRPRNVAWEWGSLRLEAGSGFGNCHFNLIGLVDIIIIQIGSSETATSIN